MYSTDDDWFYEEAAWANFGDKRLCARFKKLLKSLSQNSEESIPASVDTWGETCAAYRFFGNKKVTPDKMLSPHKQCTIERIKKELVALVPQDTSEINYSSKTDIEGLGPINTETHRGFLIHTAVAFAPDGLCLGVVSNEMWSRDSIGDKGLNRDRDIKDKESMRWIRGFEMAQDVAKQAPKTTVVSIADREGDIYEFFQQTQGVRHEAGAHWLIRCCQNRAVSAKDHGQSQRLWDAMRKKEACGVAEFMSHVRGENASRLVTQAIRVAPITLKGSRRKGKGKGLKPVTITAVLATETNPPPGKRAIEWLLLSSLPASDAESGKTLLQWYLSRWQIELFFKVLKSGCKIERLQLEHIDRLFKCVALYMIIACRIMYIRSMGKRHPSASCSLVFSADEWQSTYCLMHKTKLIPKEAPGMHEMIILVARLGGFLARKRDKYPGIQTIWKGLRRMHDCAAIWKILNPKTYV